MRKRPFPFFVFVLMMLIIVNAAGAGVEPSPFKPQLNKLNAISNVLKSIDNRLNHLLGPSDNSMEPDAFGIADQLHSMAEQFRELGTRIDEVQATFRKDTGALPMEIEESLAIVERQTYDIADSATLVFLKEERVMSAVHDLKTNIKAFAGRVARFINTPVTKVVPLSLILAQTCRPFQGSDGSRTCEPLLDYEHLQFNLRWLNDSYSSTGVKFWIKSTEGYRMPLFASELETGEAENCGSTFGWDVVKPDLKQVLSLSVPEDISDARDAGDWIRYVVNNHSDKSDLIVWLFGRESLTVRSANKDETGCPKGHSSITDYPDGHRVLMNANNMYNPANNPPNDFSPNHLVHELGHYFGLPHVWESPWGIHPTTGEPVDWSDRWDLVYCVNDLGHPFFFSSKGDAQAYSDDCNRNGGYRNIVIEGAKNCVVDNLLDEQLQCQGDSVMDCTIAGSSFSSGDSALKGLSFPTGDAESCPDLSFEWGVNAMGYWGGAFNAHVWTPGYFSASQRQLVKAHVSEGSQSDRDELGTNQDSYIWWANGDLSFAREKKPVSTRAFTPVVGDFDGNGTDDIFWYRPGIAPDIMWFSNGNRTWTPPDSSFAANEVAIPVAGDFDRNGATDILWYVPRSPTHSIWWFSVVTKGYTERTINMTPGVLRSYVPVVGNFDGLNGDDILWYEPVGGTTFMWLSDGDGGFDFESLSSPGENYTPFAGDFNCDGKADLFWYAKGSTTDKVWWADSNGRFKPSDSGDIQVQGTYSPIVGDFNGDGCSDILWDAVWHTTDFLWTGNSSKVFGKTTATAYDAFTPIPGKFDRNHTTDIFWYNSN